VEAQVELGGEQVHRAQEDGEVASAEPAGNCSRVWVTICGTPSKVARTGDA
jgi:hypothetical protein